MSWASVAVLLVALSGARGNVFNSSRVITNLLCLMCIVTGQFEFTILPVDTVLNEGDTLNFM